ncbi:hypothetical protein WJX72_003728 [[Myrmecia] bisecta]|uniref:Uncharacterized protein n=1 Tax=[Myrmecia] bisecta TaxID=41462 RepID=A0AAW1PS16_9CHLO
MDFIGLSEGLQQLPAPLFYVGATVLLLVSLLILRVASNHMTFKAPPVYEPIPFVGGLIKFVQGPMRLMSDGYRSKGEVFTVPLAHKKMTFLLGPHVSAHFFKANDDEMSQQEVYEFNVPTFGKGVVFDVDHKVRAEQFQFFAAALKTAKLHTYVPYFVSEATEFFGKWDQQGVVELQTELSHLIILTASRTLMGREVRENMFRQVTDLYHDLDMGMLPISVMFPYLPIEAHRKRDRAREELSKIFAKVIQARKASGAQENDLLQHFIESRYRTVYNGRMTNEEEITGFLIATLFAGQHTSSITSSWTGYFMMTHKEKWMKPAIEEQKRLMREHGEELSVEVLNKMEVLHAIITEALRLFPPLIMLLRKAKTSFSVTTSKGQQYVVPKGHIIFASPAFSHRLAGVFERPDEFEPDRFQAPREEDKRRPFSFIGFGAGRHGCMGSNFAYLQIKTIWSVMLRNFDFEMVDPFPQAQYNSLVVGPGPCRVKYMRRKLKV